MAKTANADIENAFVREYVQDYDPQRAALRAGYSPGYARHAAEWIREDNPTKPKLRAKVDMAVATLSRRAGISGERVLRELAAIAFADVTQIADIAEGTMREDVDSMDTRAISSVSFRKTKGGSITEIRMTDKCRALELLGKHLGLFEEKINVTGVVPVFHDDI